MPPGEFGGGFIEALFGNSIDCNIHPYFEKLANLRVSSHFLLSREGNMTQFVSTLKRAWHAGESKYQGNEKCNDFSIGIELEGFDFLEYTEEQYRVLSLLTLSICHRHPLTDIVGHQHVSPERKTDPGPNFDWKKYQADFLNLSNVYAKSYKTFKSLNFPK